MSLELLEAADNKKFKQFKTLYQENMNKKVMERVEQAKAKILGNSLIEGEEVQQEELDEDTLSIDVTRVENIEESLKSLSNLGVDAEYDEDEHRVYVENTDENKELCETWCNRFDGKIL